VATINSRCCVQCDNGGAVALDEHGGEVETVAMAIAEAAGSQVFKPLRDNADDASIRNLYRELAQTAIALTLDES
jgi:hypothetical protein